ncbi:hypothetical protein ABMA27_014918 [Loxostege sticticalis]|uniref:Peptidase S1 domain-containing protein n=1 Tax=Loxostege sticticalis TaxID=481309 RepID=A0ABR3IAN6_LOXSC
MVPVMVILCVLARAINGALRVFGGRDVDPEKYPYVVRMEVKLLYYKFDLQIQHFAHVCTASVLKPTWTLTAGHCLSFEEHASMFQMTMPGAKVEFLIRYGSKSGLRSQSDAFSDILEVVVHPGFKMLRTKEGDKVSNDVGLVKTTPIQLEQYGKLSAVNYPSLMGQPAVAVGYGLMREGDFVASTLLLGKALQALDVVVKTCDKELARMSLTPIICLSRQCREPGGAICPGDSGGPLIHHSGLVGINHMGPAIDCTLTYAKAGLSTNIVGIITPVSPFVEWIMDQIKVKSNENNERSVNLQLRAN